MRKSRPDADVDRADFKRVAHEGDFTLPDVGDAVRSNEVNDGAQLLGVGARPLPEGALEGVEGGGGGEAGLRLDDGALGQVREGGVVFGVEADVVAGVAEGLEGAIVENGVALGVDGREDRGGDGDVHAAQGDERVDGFFGRGVGRCGDRERGADVLAAVADEVMDHALGLPAHDGFKVGERVFAVANRFSGFVGGGFKLPLAFACFLPILVCKLL